MERPFVKLILNKITSKRHLEITCDYVLYTRRSTAAASFTQTA